MAVPVFADGHLWGHIGLDDCREGTRVVARRDRCAQNAGGTDRRDRLGAAARDHPGDGRREREEALRSSDLQQSLPGVIERLGQATGVDRVHIIEIDTDAPSERSPLVQHSVWSAPGVSSSVDYREMRLPMAEVGIRNPGRETGTG